MADALDSASRRMQIWFGIPETPDGIPETPDVPNTVKSKNLHDVMEANILHGKRNREPVATEDKPAASDLVWKSEP